MLSESASASLWSDACASLASENATWNENDRAVDALNANASVSGAGADCESGKGALNR